MWRAWALTLWDGIYHVRRYQSEYWLWFPTGYWKAYFSGRPLAVWMENWLGRDRYRRLLLMVRTNDHDPDLYREVYFEGRPAIGMTLAHLARGWVFSFPKTSSPWLGPSIGAHEFRIDDDGSINGTDCEISHISCRRHVDQWHDELTSYGRSVAMANEIATVEGNPIDMYPLDHGYPHVHLVDTVSPGRTLAKYRIDSFARMEGRDEWDSVMERWVGDHRDELLVSWQRCQRGRHPFKVVERSG